MRRKGFKKGRYKKRKSFSKKRKVYARLAARGGVRL